MTLLHDIWNKLSGRSSNPRPSVGAIASWFRVTWDESRVHLHVSPPGREERLQHFEWRSVTRVCFKNEGPSMSDGIYVYTSERPESYVIPTEALGGPEFWSETLRRGLFDPELLIKVASSDNAISCWPPIQ